MRSFQPASISPVKGVPTNALLSIIEADFKWARCIVEQCNPTIFGSSRKKKFFVVSPVSSFIT